MKRPFLEAPNQWLIAPRVSQTQADYAYAIQCYTHSHGWKTPALVSLGIAFTTVCLVFI